MTMTPARCDSAESVPEEGGTRGIDPGSGAIVDEQPLAPPQRALWLHQQRYPSSTAYNLAVGIRIGGPIDSYTVRAALQAVIDRHDPLRSIYRGVNGRGRRFVLARAPLELGEVMLDPPPSEGDWTDDPRVSAAIDRIARRPYRLEREAFRATLVTAGDDSHLLLVGLHHLAADGWSARQFVAEGVANFQQLVKGEAPRTEPPSLRYGAWVLAERERLAGSDAAAAFEHWERALANAAHESRIPSNLATREISLAGARLEVEIPGSTRDRLRRLAREQGASMFTGILAGCEAAIARLAAQEDVVVAVPHANRQEETRETIGLFASTLPIGGRVDGGTTFRDLIDQASVAIRTSKEHGWLPIDQILKASRVKGVASEQTLCQVMVNYLGHAVPAISLDHMEFEYLGTYDTGESQYELSIHLEDTPERMRGFVEYRANCYAEDDIRRIWDRLLAHLDAASEKPDIPLRELPIASQEDEAELWGLEQGPVRDFDHGTSLDAWVARQIQRTPNAVALSDATDRLSYSDMWCRVEALAESLRGCGVERGDTVLVCAERSVQLPIALLAILRAGAAYCPLDHEQPLARLQHVLDQASPTAIVADPPRWQLMSDLRGGDESIALLTLGSDEPVRFSAEPPTEHDDGNRSFAPDDPAYVIFTSGSTGRPKGVRVPHRGVVNRLLWMQEQFSLSTDDVVLQKTPYTFDVSVWEFFWPLMVGARLHLSDPGGHRDPEYLAEVMRDEAVTTVHFVPTMLAAFTQELGAADCPGLRRLICSGEALPGALIDKALKNFSSATLWNLYGPTEASIDVTCWQCRPQEPGAAIPIGRPISNVVCAVLDENMRRVPVGTPGELYLGGVQLALGYISQPDLTDERFVESELATGRLYKTGDLARWRGDGLLDYLGRVDRQVKIRGVRIELGEIEEVLRSMAEVADAAVTVRSDVGPSEALVAYVVPIGSPCDEVEWRIRLSRLLPDYMVPLRVVALEWLPSTASGKVDLKALPAPAVKSAEGSRELSADERLLARLWSGVLGIEDPQSIGPADSYFALGGDSMTSVKLRASARSAGFDLSLKDILSQPVLADMARALVPGTAAPQDAGLVSLPKPDTPPPGVEDAYPLSAMQAGMIFHSEFSETSSSYQVTFDLELRMPWVPAAFQEAVDELVERHEILRTSFDLHSYEEPLQLVHEDAELPVRVLDLRALTAQERQVECDRIFDAEQVRPFDLGYPPALRLALVRTGEEVAHLFMAFHDAVFDGWSGAVFMTELCTRYLAKSKGARLPDRRLSSRYRDYIALERAAVADRKGLEYWLDLCEGAPFARLPRRGQVSGTGRSRDIGLEVPHDVVEGLQSLANERAVPLKALLVTAYLAAIGRLIGERDLLAGLVSGGRPEVVDSDGMLGQFLNTVPIRAQLDGSWSSLVSRVHQAELEGIPFRRVPLFELIKRRDGQPPFETAFNLIHFHVYNELAGESDIGLLSGRFTDPFHFPLTVNVRLHPLDGALTVVVNYNESEVDAEQARRLAGDMADALATIAHDPEAACEAWLGGRNAMPAGGHAEGAPVPRAVAGSENGNDRPMDAGISDALSELWRSVLQAEGAELGQDFFAEGGDSILAVQLAARARAMGFRLRPRDIFECGTLRALVQRVEAAADEFALEGDHVREASAADPGVVAMAMRRQGGYDCSVICFELLVGLDRDAVTASTEAVLRRHQLLRSIANEEGPGRWTRRVVEVDPDRLPLSWSEDREVSRWLQGLMESVDGAHGPGTVIGYLSNSDGSAFLAFVADHASADLASLQLVGGDFLEAYAQYAAVGTVTLDPAPGLAGLEQVRLQRYDSDRAHRSTPVPWRPSVASLAGAERVKAVAIGVEMTDDLLTAASGAGVGLHHVLLVAAARALRAESGLAPNASVVLDLMDMGRTTVGIEAELVAPLAHPVPVCVPDSDEPPLAVARRIAADLLVPGQTRSRMQELVDVAGDDALDADALGVLVNHLGRVDPDLPWPLKRVVDPGAPLRGAPRRATHAIEVRSRILGGALSVELATPSSASSEEQLRAFGGALGDALLEIALEAPGAVADTVAADPVPRLL